MVQDDEITRNLTLLEYYKEQLTTLDVQQQYLQAALFDYQKAKMTVENLDKHQGEQELLIPVGSGVFISAHAKDSNKVLVDVGANIVVEKNSNDAVVNIDKRIEQVQENQNKLMNMIQQIQTEAEHLSVKTQEMINEQQR